MNKHFIEEKNPKIDNINLRILNATLFFIFFNNFCISATTNYSECVKVFLNSNSISLNKHSEIKKTSESIFIFLENTRRALPEEINQQTKKTISGTINDENNVPIIGANIVEQNTTNGTITDMDGKFSFTVAEDAILHISFIGYLDQVVNIKGKTTLNIILQEDTKSLDELVVVGYGTQKRVNLTGAVATVDVEKTIGSRPVTDLGRGLQGSSPGLLITSSSGEIGQSPDIHIRGIQGSINAQSKPLILLDNVPIPSLIMINPSDIESVSILKDAASASIYGARGTWGVILLTTKKGAKGKVNVTYDNNFAWSSPANTPEIADGAEGAEFMLKVRRRTAPNTDQFNILGAYYDDLSIERMRQWKLLYGKLDLGDEMVEGRDFEIRNGQIYHYRPWNVDNIFLNNSSPQQRHNLSISGGSDNTNYFASVSYLNQEGLVKISPEPDKFRRFTGNMRVESKVTNWFTVRTSLMISNSNKDYPNFRLRNAGAPTEYWYNIYRYPETYPYGTFNGLPLKNIRTELEQAHMNETNSAFNRFQAGATITFLKGWNADIDYTYATNNSHDKVASSPITGINNWNDPTLTNIQKNFFPAEDYVRVNSSWNNRNVGKAYTTYTTKIKNHNFKLMAGGDIEYYKSNFQFSEAYGQMLPSKPELNLTTGAKDVNGYPSHWSTLGFFGRLNYSYLDKYLFEANIRRDGASQFPKNQKWGVFPSISAGYVVSNEEFLDDILNESPLSFLKIRGSWGSIGNNNVGGQSYLRVMNAGNSNWWIDGQNQVSVGVFGNIASSLTWETVETLDLGLNAKFFKDALDIEFDWYSRSTKDMVTSGLELPLSLGSSPSARNFGVLVTKGWELSISYNKLFNNDFGFNITGVLSDAIGKITTFSNKEVNIKTGGNSTPYYEGMTIGEIWGYESDRLFTEDDFSGNNGAANPTWFYGENTPDQDALNTSGAFHYGPGDVKYKDINGDGVVDFGAGTNFDSGDMRIIGNTTPRYLYGLRLGTNYKGFDFSAFIQGVGKRDYWATGSLFIPAFTQNEAVYQNQMDYWTPENPDAYYPAPHNPGANNHNGNWQPQTRYLVNMAYLRMKNITIGYTLPLHWLSNIGIKKLHLFISGENLFDIDNLNIIMDPEIDHNLGAEARFGRTYPYFRTWSIGMQVNL